MKIYAIVAVATICATVGCEKTAQESISPSDSQGISEQSNAAVHADGVKATTSTVATPAATGARLTFVPASGARFPEMLPSERSVIDGAGISVAKVTAVIKTDDFGKFVRDLANESAADPLAQDLTALERKRWEGKLGGEARLRDFACGLSVCAGSIALGNNVGVYDRISDDYLSNGTQPGSLLDYRLDRGGGDYEQRFVMSVDPAVAGITFDKRPTAPRR